MNIHKLTFTRLQQEILSYLFLRAGSVSTANALARHLDVSPTAIAKALPLLVEEGHLTVRKDEESRRLSIQMRREDPHLPHLKRVENLRLLYVSGLVEALADTHPGATIVLFGSFAFGEDTIGSDIDIAIIGKKRDLPLERFEKLLAHKISLQYYPSGSSINIHLKESLCNGITLRGHIEL